MIYKLGFILALVGILFGCKSDDDRANDAQSILPNVPVSFEVNLNLPQFKNLQFPGNSYVETQQGINGVVIYNVDGNQFTTFEITDPNHRVQDCSKMTLEGVVLTCQCSDGNQYDILTGQRRTNPGQGSTLLRYRNSKRGNTLFITK